jgi:hypothetical protein
MPYVGYPINVPLLCAKHVPVSRLFILLFVKGKEKIVDIQLLTCPSTL